GLDLAGKLLKDEMLILHFGAELGRLEKPLPVPVQSIDRSLVHRHGADWRVQPLVEELNCLCLCRASGQHCPRVADYCVLGMLQQAIMFGMEDVMNGGEADIFVAATVT